MQWLTELFLRENSVSTECNTSHSAVPILIEFPLLTVEIIFVTNLCHPENIPISIYLLSDSSLATHHLRGLPLTKFFADSRKTSSAWRTCPGWIRRNCSGDRTTCPALPHGDCLSVLPWTTWSASHGKWNQIYTLGKMSTISAKKVNQFYGLYNVWLCLLPYTLSV